MINLPTKFEVSVYPLRRNERWHKISKIGWFGVVRGHSRSLKILPFDRMRTSSYKRSTVTMPLSCTVFEIWWDTRVYPAKGQPGSGTTKLDSGAQKRLIRSCIEGYGPRPQARARLARAAVVPPASAQASRRTRRPLLRPVLVAHADFLTMGHFAPFSQFLHIKGRNLPDVFYPFTSTYDPYEPWKVSWKSVFTFLRNPEDRQTDAAALYI